MILFRERVKRGLNITSSLATWVEVKSSGKGKPKLNASTSADIPKGLITPFFAKRNIDDPVAFKTIIKELIPAGHMAGDIALSIPDHIAKITSLRFDDLPDSRQEIEQLILWRLKKTLPLPPDALKLDFIRYKSEDGGCEVMASLASREVLREYEDIFKELGLRPRHVNIASLNALKVFEQAVGASSLFVELSDRSLGMAIIDEGRLAFFRSKEIEGKTDKITKEINSTLAYFRSNFPEKNISSICFHPGGQDAEDTIAELEGNFEGSIMELAISGYMEQEGEDNIDERLAPAVGGALGLK